MMSVEEPAFVFGINVLVDSLLNDRLGVELEADEEPEDGDVVVGGRTFTKAYNLDITKNHVVFPTEFGRKDSNGNDRAMFCPSFLNDEFALENVIEDLEAWLLHKFARNRDDDDREPI